MRYHLIAAFFSNTIWFVTFRQLVKADMTFVFFLPYCVGTMCGSLCGVRISMFFEKLLGAEADGHLKKKPIEVTTNVINQPKKLKAITIEDLAAYWDFIDTGYTTRKMRFRDWIKAGKPKGIEIIKEMSDELRYARYKDSRKEFHRLNFEAWKRADKPD